MTDESRLVESQNQLGNGFQRGILNTLKRVLEYTFIKVITLVVAVAIGLYLAILVANIGGYIDEIYQGIVNETVRGIALSGEFKNMPIEQKEQELAKIQWQLEESYGLHEPFLLRTLRLFRHSITLDLGEARFSYNFVSRDQVKNLILETLPYTLLLTGLANILVFVTSVLLALKISRKYGSFLDKFMIALSPLSSAPSWVIGVLLIVIFAAGLHILPFPRQVDILAAENWISYVPYLFQYMILPFSAVFLGAFFQSVYAWRTYFLIYSGEEYVEMAKARGLPSNMVERSHILKPAMPYLITSFALMMIGLWQGSIALEVLFYWQGIGNLFIQAVRRFDVQLVIGIVVVFAYLLAATVFILDIIYAVIDPRVRIEGRGSSLRSERRLKGWGRLRLQKSASTVLRKNWSNPFSDEEKRAYRQQKNTFQRRWRNLAPILKEIRRYPSAVVGVVIILIFVGVAIYAPFAVPYEEAISVWRREENDFYQNPRIVPPEWINLFLKDDLPSTLIMNSHNGEGTKMVEAVSAEMTKITITFPFDYEYKAFPQDLVLFFEPTYDEKMPLVSMIWVRPDGLEINLGQQSVTHSRNAYYLSQDETIRRRLGDIPLEDSLFADGEVDGTLPLPGSYEMRITSFVFEPDADMDVEMVLYGRVYGLAGTDHQRRDLMVALLWGMPVALSFGILGAVVTNLLSMIIAAFGAWFGGWVDNLIQRITEVNMILPTLPVAIMVFILYSNTIWAILGVVVLLSIFGSSVKNFRAAFLQMRDDPYIEGARAYGAGNWRIITRYLVPRILPIMIPQLVIMVPGYVFYEATLAYLGLSDPVLPTWGKIIYDALTIGAYKSDFYWILEPIGLLLITGMAFAMLGFALDRILNPKLREQ